MSPTLLKSFEVAEIQRFAELYNLYAELIQKYLLLRSDISGRELFNRCATEVLDEGDFVRTVALSAGEAIGVKEFIKFCKVADDYLKKLDNERTQNRAK